MFLRAPSLQAQETPTQRLPSELQLAAVNVAAGSITAAVWRAATGKSVWKGAARGAVAGLAAYGGKRIIGTSGKPLHWWAGRQVNAIAGSEVLNAAESRPIFDKVVIPIGPVRFHVDRSKGLRISPRIDAVSVAAGIALATHDGHRFALDESLATGTIAFLSRETSQQIGGNVGAVITISELTPDGVFYPLESKRRVIAHELAHTAQYDFVFAAWSDPVQKAIAAKSPMAARISRYLDINSTLVVQLAANTMLEYKDRPWEKEAKAIALRTR